MNREYLAEMHPKTVILDGPEFDEAIVGSIDGEDDDGEAVILIYSEPRLLRVLERQMSAEDAKEHLEYNIHGTMMGVKNGPLFMSMEWGD